MSSACVGRRFSLNCCGFHPPATINHDPGFIVRAASFTRPSASSSVRTPIQFTSVVKLSAARIAWRCESMSPGMTVRPPRSITRDRGPASFRISADVPSAVMCPSRIAIASRTDDCASTVRILPFTRTVSGACARAGIALTSASSRRALTIRRVIVTSVRLKPDTTIRLKPDATFGPAQAGHYEYCGVSSMNERFFSSGGDGGGEAKSSGMSPVSVRTY